MKIITLLAIIIMPVFSFSQCNNQLINMVLQDNGGATSLKEFPVRLKKVKKKDPNPYARFSVHLRKGSQYRFNIKNDSLNSANASLILSNDYKVYGNTYDAYSSINKDYFDFFCKLTGTYYLTIQFDNHNGGCAVGLLSLVNEFDYYEQ